MCAPTHVVVMRGTSPLGDADHNRYVLLFTLRCPIESCSSIPAVALREQFTGHQNISFPGVLFLRFTRRRTYGKYY